MSKRKRSLLLQRGVMIFSALATAAAVAPLLAGVMEGGVAAATASAEAATTTTTEEEAVSVTAAAESGLKKRSSEALGKAAEGGGQGGVLKKGSQEWNEAFRQKYRRGISEYKVVHSERFQSLHNALWRKSFQSGQLSRQQLVAEGEIINQFYDKEILKLGQYQSLEQEAEFLDKARLVEQDFQRQKLDLEWLADSTPKLQIPLGKAAGGGGGGGTIPTTSSFQPDGGQPVSLDEKRKQVLALLKKKGLTQEQGQQLVRDIDPFHTMSREGVLSAMPDDLKKLHSDLVKLHPELHDVPILFRSDLELSSGNFTSFGDYHPQQRYIKLNKSNIEAQGLSVRSVVWHEAAHALELPPV